jgi:MFS family permease
MDELAQGGQGGTDANRASPTPERPFGARFVMPMLMGSSLNPINSSMIATALVSIAAAMHVSVGRASILISSLYLTSAVAQPTAGRLSEELGPRRVFVAGVGVVLAGGLLGGFAESMAILVASRVLIGLGTSAGYPSAMLLIRRRASVTGLAAPPGSVMGGLAIAGSASTAIGPAIGGLLIEWFSWRAAFLINIPLALIACLMALLWIGKDPDSVRGLTPRHFMSRIDVAGVIGFGGAMTGLLIFLMSLPNVNWTPFVVSVVVAVALIFWELRADKPFFDIRTLTSNLSLTRTYVRYGLSLLGVYVILYGLTQWIEAARGLSAYEAGLALIPMGVLSAVMARLASHHVRLQLSLTVSALMMLGGSVATAFLTSHSPVVTIIGVTSLFGLMSGSSVVANQTALYRESVPEKVGTAFGLLRTFGYVGSIASATIIDLVFRQRVDDTGLHRISLIMIVIGTVVLLITLLDRKLASSDSLALASTHV